MKLKANESIVRGIVETNGKQRFSMKDNDDNDGEPLIRSNQGHSMEGIDM